MMKYIISELILIIVLFPLHISESEFKIFRKIEDLIGGMKNIEIELHDLEGKETT